MQPALLPRYWLLAFLLLTAFSSHAQWTADSLLNTVVRDSSGRQETTPLLVAGPGGSTYVAWFEAAAGTNYELRMQRVDANGRPLWPRAGLVVSRFPQNSALFRYDLKADLNGDALVAFQDERTGTLQPVIYKVTAAGTLAWGSGILLTDSLATGGLAPVVGITSSNNVVVAWNASASGAGWIAARKFSPTGTQLWPTPYRVRDPAGTIAYTRPAWLAAGTDDALLFYVEQTGRFPFTSHVFAQRLNAAGQSQWQAQLNSGTSLPFTFFPSPLSDGKKGAYLIYNAGNPANLTLTTVFAQHLRAAGTTAWGADGIELVTGTATVRFAADAGAGAMTDSAAGELTALVTEQNISQSMGGLTIQRLDSSGNRLLGPAGRVLLAITGDLHRAVGLRGAGAGQSIACYTTGGGLSQTISALLLDPSGAPAWTAAPARVVSAASSGKDDIGLVPVRGGQLVVGWADDRRGGGLGINGIYAQTIGMNGRLGGSVITATAPQLSAATAASIWPNPATDAYLRFPATTTTPALLTLRDVTGRIVYQQPFVLTPAGQDLRLPGAGLLSGLYQVTLTTSTQHVSLRWLKL